MSKVYVVAYSDYDEYNIEGVFSNKEAADRLAKLDRKWDVDEFDLDPPILYPDEGELFYRFDTDNGYVWLEYDYPFLWPDQIELLGTFVPGGYPNKDYPDRVSGSVLVHAFNEQEAIAKMKAVLDANGLPFVRMQNR
jgi:hypothetical protein